jgi:hypothetical protein
MHFKNSVMAMVAGAFLLAPSGASPSYATDDRLEYFYAEIEGGFAWIEGADSLAIAPVRALEFDGGGYGTLTLGHVDVEAGIIGGYVDRAELWLSYFDHGDEAFPSTTFSVSADRDYWEVGTRFQHYFETDFSSTAMWGFEPFYGQFSTEIILPPTLFVAESQTDVFGAMLSLENEWIVGTGTSFFTRAAGGIYFTDAEYQVASTGFTISDDDAGFRGQLAAGFTQDVTSALEFGLVGRLDYFSAVGRFNNSGAIGLLEHEGLLALSVGATLKLKFDPPRM